MGCGSNKTVKEVRPKRNTVLLVPGQFVRGLEEDINALYRLGDVLGTGSFGKVVSAVHRFSSERRAVKIINKTSIKNEERRKRILNEVEIQKKLDHPNIVKIFEFYEDQDHLYIIMEECTGGELLSAISKSGSINETLAANYMKQILSALVYLHSKNIVHRDLKLENMLLEKPQSSTLKLADFGIATFLSPGTKLESAMGTLTYIAPEVFKRKYDGQCDMWSAGVIMFILISGVPPFKGANKKKTVKKITKGKFSLNKEAWLLVSEDCKTFLSGLLTVDPAARLTPQEAYNSKWLQSSGFPKVSKTLLEESARNLKRFMASHKFQKAVIRFITSQLLTQADTQELDQVFKTVNKSGSGQVSPEELVEYLKTHFNEQVDEQLMTSIFSRVDTDNNGIVDYSEFIAAAVGKDKMVCIEKLKTAFNAIASENTGKISLEQLKSFLRTEEDTEVSAYQKLITLVDKNQDGFIDFQEFQAMMEEVFQD